MGRYLRNTISNLGLTSECGHALDALGARLEDLYDEENDAALGSGGLGRLAACFLDSLATLNYPAWGYGIRYEFGMFKQNIVNGMQQEVPEYWLVRGNPWEIPRRDITYPIQFAGQITTVKNPVTGDLKYKYVDLLFFSSTHPHGSLRNITFLFVRNSYLPHIPILYSLFFFLTGGRAAASSLPLPTIPQCQATGPRTL